MSTQIQRRLTQVEIDHNLKLLKYHVDKANNDGHLAGLARGRRSQIRRCPEPEEDRQVRSEIDREVRLHERHAAKALTNAQRYAGRLDQVEMYLSGTVVRDEDYREGVKPGLIGSGYPATRHHFVTVTQTRVILEVSVSFSRWVGLGYQAHFTAKWNGHDVRFSPYGSVEFSADQEPAKLEAIPS